jgi:hypothetical protein
LSLLLCSFFVALSVAAQQAPQRDPQAFAVLQRAVTAMGGLVPSDSVATGNVVLVEGSKTEQGTIRILTRGTDQSAEQIQTPDSQRAVIYSQNWAKETRGTTVKRLPLQLVVTSQSPDFPLPLLAAAFTNPDTVVSFLGQETLNLNPAP